MSLTAGARASTKRFSPTEIGADQLHYLVDLTYAGQVHHLSRTPVDVESKATGEVYAYDGSLEAAIEWEDAMELFSSSSEIAGVSISCVLPVSVPQLVAEGHDLSEAVAELSLWIEGTDYEDRRIMLIGGLTDPTHGFADDPITGTIQAEAFEDAGLIPAANQVVSLTAWPNAADNAVGMAYPFVFGQNEAYATPPAGNEAVSPAYVVDTTLGVEVLLIAGHAVYATQVRVKSTNTAYATVAVTKTTDGLGNVVSVLAAGTFTYIAGNDYAVSWELGGAYPNKTGTGAIVGAGDVLELLLERSTLPLDRGRIAAAKGPLNAFKLAGCFAESVTPYEFITANLSPILPMTLVRGPFGVYPVVWNFGATLKDVVERVDADVDPTIEIESPIAYEGGGKDIFNEFTLRYGLEQIGSFTRRSITLGAKRDPDDPDSAESLSCRASQAKYGRRAKSEESIVVHDAATARLIVGWWARAKSLPTRTVAYSVGYDRAWLERGNVVSITDSRLALSNQIALVEGILYREDATIVVYLRIMRSPAQGFHVKGA